MNAFISINRPVLLIGNAGCGKTQLAKGVLNKLDPENFCYTIINMNYYTDAVMI
jgi:dynein heavy chain